MNPSRIRILSRFINRIFNAFQYRKKTYKERKRVFLENLYLRHSLISFIGITFLPAGNENTTENPYESFLNLLSAHKIRTQKLGEVCDEEVTIKVSLIFFLSHFLSAYVSATSLKLLVFGLTNRQENLAKIVLGKSLPSQLYSHTSFFAVNSSKPKIFEEEKQGVSCLWGKVDRDTAAIFLDCKGLTFEQTHCLVQRIKKAENLRYIVLINATSFLNFETVLLFAYKHLTVKNVRNHPIRIDIFEAKTQSVFSEQSEDNKSNIYVPNYRSAAFSGSKKFVEAKPKVIPNFHYQSFYLGKSNEFVSKSLVSKDLTDEGSELFSLKNIILQGDGDLTPFKCPQIKEEFISLKIQKLQGSYVLLPTQVTHHSHFLAETLSNMYLLEFAPSDTKYIAFDTLSNSQREYLTYFGVKQEDILFLTPKDKILVEELFLFGGNYGYRPESISYFHKFVPRDKNEPRSCKSKIYISRLDSTNYRNLINEHECVEIFKQYGFDIVEASKLNAKEKVSLFASADYIAGPLGAGLHPIVFSLGKHVIPISTNEYLPQEFFRMWGLLGCKVFLVKGKCLFGLDRWRGSHSSYYVEPSLLSRTLDKVLQ